MELLFSHKMNEVLIPAITWMNLQHVTSHITQFYLHEISIIDKFIGKEYRLLLARCWRKGKCVQRYSGEMEMF